jgi:hypothetical protein
LSDGKNTPSNKELEKNNDVAYKNCHGSRSGKCLK